jgi:hypothetical protein
MHAMEGAPELRVPKQAVAVELARAGRSPEHVELFVDGADGHTALAAQVAELLEASTQFVPVREPDAPGGARVALVGKRSVVWVAVPLAHHAGGGPRGDAIPPPLEDEPSEIIALFDHRHEVKVELATDETLDGYVLYSSPADRPRLADHLNLPVQFLRVWTPDALYLINKQHVVRVLELD